jgi:hypothetical protein
VTREEAVRQAEQFAAMSAQQGNPAAFEVVQIGKRNPTFRAQLFGQHVFRKQEHVTDVLTPQGRVTGMGA